jgi:hypothetical protein
VLFSIPVNWIIAKFNVKYEKGIATARDKRTSVVNELISSVSAPDTCSRTDANRRPQIKFIKFGGAEERWLKKANDARDVELDWFLKSIARSPSFGAIKFAVSKVDLWR